MITKHINEIKSLNINFDTTKYMLEDPFNIYAKTEYIISVEYLMNEYQNPITYINNLHLREFKNKLNLKYEFSEDEIKHALKQTYPEKYL